MKRHAIVTASDARCGDFLADHWLPSLRENVRLDDIDVVVLDFGLDPSQRARLDGVILERAATCGSVNVARRGEVGRLLERRSYDQVLVVDAGDLVFQADVSGLFEQDRDLFRGVPERYPIPLPPFLRGASREQKRRIRAALRGRAMVNGGFLLAPARRLHELGEAVLARGRGLRHDQPLVSSLLYEWGFAPLDPSYNFVLWTTPGGFRVEKGLFLRRRDGARLHVVHNTGLRAPFRIVRDFGYGPERNQEIRTSHLWLAAIYGRVHAALGGAPRVVPVSSPPPTREHP